MFKNILSATDLVGTCDAPVTAALELAKKNNGHLRILHVLESASSHKRHLVKHFKTGEELENSREYEQEVVEAIRNVYADYFSSFSNYDIIVTIGYPFEVILLRAREIEADLIVIGPHSSRAQEKGEVRIKGKVGSTVEGVIINECCPVMIVNQQVLHHKLQFKRLVLGIDFSKSCLCAFRYALKLARFHGSKIYAYNMLPVPPSNHYTQAIYDAEITSARKKLDSVCRETPPEIDAECTVCGGVHPHLEILKFAARKEADTILMGSHTKDKSGKWYVGSVVERVSYRATCPVIVITDPEILSKT